MPARIRSKSRARKIFSGIANETTESTENFWQNVKNTKLSRREIRTKTEVQDSVKRNLSKEKSHKKDRHNFWLWASNAGVAMALIALTVAQCSYLEDILPKSKTNIEQKLFNEVQLYANSTFFVFRDPPLIAQFVHLVNRSLMLNDVSLLRAIRGSGTVFGYLRIFIIYLIMQKFVPVSRFFAMLGFVILVLNSKDIPFQSGLFLTYSCESCLLFASILVFSQIGSVADSRHFWCVFLSNVAISGSFCLRYSAASSLWIVFALITMRKVWNLLDNPNIRIERIIGIMVLDCVIFLSVPLITYGIVVYAHITSLVNSWPDARLLSSQFQASLESEFSKVTSKQLEIVYPGSRVTLRNTHAKTPCWLHSGETVYPVNYEDQRGSSHQQVVSCFPQKHVDNWWFVTSQDVTDGPIRDGDEIQLIHARTRRLLNSHDVAAPMSPRSQEVSCYMDYNVSMELEPNWIVIFVNDIPKGEDWKAISSKVIFIHSSSGHNLRMTGRKLPHWVQGTHFEVVADSEEGFNVWNIEEHKNEEVETPVNTASVMKTTHFMSFWAKALEIHTYVLFSMQPALDSRTYYFSIADFLVYGVSTEILIEKNTTSSNQDYDSHFVERIQLLDLFVRVGVIFSGILCLYGLIAQHRSKILAEQIEFRGLIDAWKIVGSGSIAMALPFFYYERPVYVEELHILSDCCVILLIVGISCVFYQTKHHFLPNAI